MTINATNINMKAYNERSNELTRAIDSLTGTHPHDSEKIAFNLKKVKEACAECLKTLPSFQELSHSVNLAERCVTTERAHENVMRVIAQRSIELHEHSD
jgi:hypothetical protein